MGGSALLGLILSVAGLVVGIPLLWRYGKRRRAVAYGVLVIIAPHIFGLPDRFPEGQLKTLLIYGLALLVPVYALLGWFVWKDLDAVAGKQVYLVAGQEDKVEGAYLTRHGWTALVLALLAYSAFTDASGLSAPTRISILLGAILFAATGVVLLWEARSVS